MTHTPEGTHTPKGTHTPERTRRPEGDLDSGATVTMAEAAVELGVSPTELCRLLDTGVLPSVNTSDVRVRRVSAAALQRHRTDRFALRQKLAEQAHVLHRRRWTGTGAS